MHPETGQGMFDWFLEIWDQREITHPDTGARGCWDFETGEFLPRLFFRENPSCYSHTLEKSSYPQYAFSSLNLCIVNPNTHSAWHISKDNCPLMKKLEEKLFELHKQDKLK